MEGTRQERDDLTVFADWYSIWPGAMGPGRDGEAVSMDAPRGVRLAVQPAQLTDEVLSGDQPWEQDLGYVTVLKTESGFRMWYNAHAYVTEDGEAVSLERIKREDPWAQQGGQPPPKIAAHLCYAESDDGFSWRKPNVGLYEFAGSKANNIVFPEALEGSVFADPACGFRIFAAMERGQNAIWSAMRTASSADGIHWTKDEGMVIDLHCDTQNVAYYDKGLGSYVVYVRYARGGGGHRRAVGRSEAKTFRDLPHPEVVFEADSQDPPSDVIYSPAYARHPDCDGSDWQAADTDRMGKRKSITAHLGQNLHFMFPAVYHMDRDVTSVQLAVSRDGKQWTRPERKPMIELPSGHDYSVYAFPGIHMLKPNVWGVLFHAHRRLHNTGYWRGHHQADSLDSGYRWATWKENRFVALQADADGACTAMLPRCPRNEIRLNLQTLLEGWIRVELIRARKMWPPEPQRGIEGYTFGDCDIIRGDSLSHTVTWRGKSALPELGEDEELALRLHLSRAKLFAIHSS